MSKKLPNEMQDWIEETWEQIYEKYRRAGTELKGGLPIAKALEEAYRKGWDACLLEIADRDLRAAISRATSGNAE